jgi:phosphatidylglycerophosphate synthase
MTTPARSSMPPQPAGRRPVGVAGAQDVLPALRRSAAVNIALAAGALLLLTPLLARAAGLGADYPAKVLVLFAAGAALVWRGLAGGAHPHARFGPANRVTLLRLALGAALAGLVGEAAAATALAWALVVVATLTALLDAVDGALARRSGLASAFGARFDMETDAAFTLVLCVLVWQAGQAGPWVLASGLMRYAFVAAAAVWPWLSAPLLPSRRRQTVCVVQITALIVCLGPVVPPPLAAALAAASLALLGLSFAVDVRWLAQTRHRPPETPP